MLLGEIGGAALAALCFSAFGFYGACRILLKKVWGLGYRKPFSCPLCMGFWYGVFAGPVFFRIDSSVEPIALGLVAGGACWLMGKFITGEN